MARRGGAVCEVNGQPGFRPHWLAAPERDINAEVLDALFDGRPARIPTAAITGTNGKTTTAEMLYRIWSTAGKVRLASVPPTRFASAAKSSPATTSPASQEQGSFSTTPVSRLRCSRCLDAG